MTPNLDEGYPDGASEPPGRELVRNAKFSEDIPETLGWVSAISVLTSLPGDSDAPKLAEPLAYSNGYHLNRLSITI